MAATMPAEQLAGIMERTRLWAEQDDPCVGLADVQALLVEVWRCRIEHTYVTRLAGRVQARLAGGPLAFREDIVARLEAEVAQAANEDSQEVL